LSSAYAVMSDLFFNHGIPLLMLGETPVSLYSQVHLGAQVAVAVERLGHRDPVLAVRLEALRRLSLDLESSGALKEFAHHLSHVAVVAGATCLGMGSREDKERAALRAAERCCCPEHAHLHGQGRSVQAWRVPGNFPWYGAPSEKEWEGSDCLVCCSSKATAALACGHQGYCPGCVKQLSECPVCRREVEFAINLWPP
jgi:hypothetical protein